MLFLHNSWGCVTVAAPETPSPEEQREVRSGVVEERSNLAVGEGQVVEKADLLSSSQKGLSRTTEGLEPGPPLRQEVNRSRP